MGVQHRRPAKRDRRGRGERRRPLGLLPEPRLGLLRRRNHQGFAPFHGERHRHAAQRRPPDGIPGIRLHELRPETGAVAHHRRDQLPGERIRQNLHAPAHRGAAPRDRTDRTDRIGKFAPSTKADLSKGSGLK